MIEMVTISRRLENVRNIRKRSGTMTCTPLDAESVSVDFMVPVLLSLDDVTWLGDRKKYVRKKCVRICDACLSESPLSSEIKLSSTIEKVYESTTKTLINTVPTVLDENISVSL